MTNKYFLGIDIGSTKSHALIATETGEAVGFGVGGPGNYEMIGWDGLEEVLHTITNQALATAGIKKDKIAAAGFGISGYDWPEDWEPTYHVIATLDLAGPVRAVNDALIGLLAGSIEGWGLAVVSGTSCNCWGRDTEGRQGRVSGMGTWLAEHGGGSELVAKAVQAVSLAWTKRGPTTALTDTFINETGASDVVDLLSGLFRGRYSISSTHAPLVFKIAEEGDEVAQNIIKWIGRELGSLASGVIKQLKFEDLAFDVVLVGSLYKGSPLITSTLKETVHAVAPKASLVRLETPPVVGGVLLGMEKANFNYKPIWQTLIDSTNNYVERGTWSVEK